MKVKFDIDRPIVDESGAISTIDVLANIKPTEFAKLQAAACKRFGDYDTMELGDYIHCMNGEFSCINFDSKHIITVGQLIWIEGYKRHLDSFVKALDNVTVKQTIDEKRASENLPTFDFEQGALIFCKDYFGLKNFDITGIKVWEYMLAKKDTFVKCMYQKNFDKIQQNKMKK